MRRMLPQKLIDYIKELKKNINAGNDGIFMNANEIYANIFSTPDDEVRIDSDGITFNNETTISSIGDGLEVENGVLSSILWRKLEVTAIYDENEDTWSIDELPSEMGNEIIFVFYTNDNKHTLVLQPGLTILDGAAVTRDDFLGGYAFNISGSSYIVFKSDMPLAGVDTDFVIYYKAYRGRSEEL